MSAAEARAAAELATRASYGRLIALLSAASGDIALAEDVLSSALEEALRRWPETGVPASPEGWLLTVARNRQRDVWRSAATRTNAPLDADASVVDVLDDFDPLAIGDKRLELLFVCAHPAIDERARSALMLQAVLGFEAADIARAFAVTPAAMAQRLVRAKQRIRATRIPFVVPDRRAMAERLPTVLEAIYGCAALSWRGGARSLAGEAQYLAVALARLLLDESEAWGLAALTTLTLARRRVGEYLPLSEQDPRDWNGELIAEGEEYLRRAQPIGPPGRFQLEAAIHAVHCHRRATGVTDWAALRTLYTALLAVAPTIGARVAAAVVIGEIEGPQAGLAALPEGAEAFQPYWAARAELLSRAGRDASSAYARAAELSSDPHVAVYLRSHERRYRDERPLLA